MFPFLSTYGKATTQQINRGNRVYSPNNGHFCLGLYHYFTPQPRISQKNGEKVFAKNTIQDHIQSRLYRFIGSGETRSPKRKKVGISYFFSFGFRINLFQYYANHSLSLLSIKVVSAILFSNPSLIIYSRKRLFLSPAFRASE